MNISGNTILITGGASGIGRALAEAFHAEDNQVIIAGRREALLQQVAAANPGMRSVVLDIENSASIRAAAARMRTEWPMLNTIIHCAGIMRDERLQADAVADAEATIATNLLGPIRLNAALLGLLEAQPRATIITVSSGLAFLPKASSPTYCATKAAIHSWTQSLRYQLRDTNVQVLELIPPYVQTELTGAQQAADPAAMPLADYIAETLHILKSEPELTEICVERVKPLRFAEVNGNYAGFFKSFNDAQSELADR